MNASDTREQPTVLVTGGAGYLGDVLVGQLLDGSVLSPREVRVFDLRESPRAGDPRVRSVVADVRDGDALRDAARGADVVIHSAAQVDWGRVPDAQLEAVNVGGTRNAIAACRAAGVPALVHTSTLDVVYDGRPVLDGDETLPYPARFPNAYCRTKAEAERIALAANGAPLDDDGGGTLRTSVIRPCSIFGEGDPFHIGSLVEMARRRQLFRVGDGSARSQFTYVGNVAHAHLLAARSLLSDAPRAAGEVYFALDFPPENFFDFLAPFVEAAGHRMPPPSRGLPRAPLYALGWALESLSRALGPAVRFAPTVTTFAVDFVTLDFTLSSDKAARDLGYAPRFTREEAFERTLAWYRTRR